MIEVVVRNDDIDGAIRVLKRSVRDVYQELKRRSKFVKPSEKRRAKQRIAAARRRKMEKNNTIKAALAHKRRRTYGFNNQVARFVRSHPPA